MQFTQRQVVLVGFLSTYAEDSRRDPFPCCLRSVIQADIDARCGDNRILILSCN
jgi:hypothetical protein